MFDAAPLRCLGTCLAAFLCLHFLSQGGDSWDLLDCADGVMDASACKDHYPSKLIQMWACAQDLDTFVHATLPVC